MSPLGVSLPVFLLWICTLQGVPEPVLLILQRSLLDAVLAILQEVGVGYVLHFPEV